MDQSLSQGLLVIKIKFNVEYGQKLLPVIKNNFNKELLPKPFSRFVCPKITNGTFRFVMCFIENWEI